MHINELLEQGRRIWPERMEQDEIAVCLGVVFGCICRNFRDAGERADLKRELGNIIFSTIRWADDLGLEPEDCIRVAIQAQKDFRVKHGLDG